MRIGLLIHHYLDAFTISKHLVYTQNSHGAAYILSLSLEGASLQYLTILLCFIQVNASICALNFKLSREDPYNPYRTPRQSLAEIRHPRGSYGMLP